jgi:two-component system, NarL family, nitrate/nitrite response regulator NarL
MGRSTQAPRIVLGDATPMQCELLANALKKGREFHVLATAADSKQLLRSINEFAPSIAVLSVDLQDGPRTGLSVLAETHAKCRRTQCVVLLDRSDRNLVVAAFRNGARGVFFRAQPIEQLRKCLRIVHQGQIWANTREMNYILEAFAHVSPLHLFDGDRKSALTHREEEVARLVAEGLTNREIAGKLHLSEHTVKNYVFSIFEKTGVSNRVGLALYAFSQQESDPMQTA